MYKDSHTLFLYINSFVVKQFQPPFIRHRVFPVLWAFDVTFRVL